VSRLAELDDGLLVVVKSDCETCQMVEPVLGVMSARNDVAIASQDDPSFPPGLGVIDDTDLELSWDLQTETTPTLYRIEQGKVVESATGWNREEWQRLTGIEGLGSGLPASRPGCGSKIFEPGTFERLSARSGGLRARRVTVAPAVDPFEAMMSFGWSDGLPVVPPTEDRVQRMLEGTSRDPGEIVCVMAPDLVECTVEKVAINAVMAGCRPEYLPVVLAGCEAVSTDLFNIHGVAATTQFAGPVLIVNGPIRLQLQMNSGINALGPGNRPNATIGRAVNLVVRNLGGARPGGVDRSTLGSPAKWSLCFAEDEEGSPWEPLSIERGMAEGVSAVSAFAGHGPHEIVDQASRDATSLASSFAAQLRSVGHPKLMGSLDALVVVAPEHARVFTDSGWDKPRLRHELTERLTFDGDEVVKGAGGIAEGVPRPKIQPRMTKFRPDGLWFAHAGGTAGMFSGIISGWTGGPRGSQMATVSIDNWK
jgi:hypothetical protein